MSVCAGDLEKNPTYFFLMPVNVKVERFTGVCNDE